MRVPVWLFASQEAAAEFNIDCMPTFVVLWDNKEVGRMKGADFDGPKGFKALVNGHLQRWVKTKDGGDHKAKDKKAKKEKQTAGAPVAPEKKMPAAAAGSGDGGSKNKSKCKSDTGNNNNHGKRQSEAPGKAEASDLVRDDGCTGCECRQKKA